MGTTQTRTNLIATAFIIGGILLVIGALFAINAINRADNSNEATVSPVTKPEPATVECLTISPDALAGIQWGLDQRQPDLTATSGATVNTGANSWTVAATFTGPGIEQAIGIWHTTQNPTGTGTFAYTSVDAIAAEFTAYAQPDNPNRDGADDAKDCLP